MKVDTGIGHRLLQAFLTQAALISVTALLGVYAARFVIGDILIQQALDKEAAHYWHEYRQDPQTPRPNTYNLTGYLTPADTLPEAFRSLDPGLHKLASASTDYYLVHVSRHGEHSLYLEFNGQQVSELALFFGIFPLAGFLIVIYLSAWVAYRFLSRAVSPITRLARTLENLDPGSEEFVDNLKQSFPEPVGQEVAVLSRALADLSDRIGAFVLRERNFTRDASHELRSPVTVIKMATDLLLDDHSLSAEQHKLVQRIKANATDMEELLEALLILARESENVLPTEAVCVNELVAEEIERARSILPDKPIEISLAASESLIVIASARVLSVLIGNLLRNALSYTDKGGVKITLRGSELTIEDSGAGMQEQDIETMFKPFRRGAQRQRGGYGVGLTIVKMLSERFRWPVHITSRPGIGTRVTVNFRAPNAEQS